jgi:hypothetical protein
MKDKLKDSLFYLKISLAFFAIEIAVRSLREQKRGEASKL